MANDQIVNATAEETAVDSVAATGNMSLRHAAVLMIVTTMLSRITGLVQIMVLSHRFGVSADLSAFYQALTIPDFVYFLIAGGALRTGFVPVMSEQIARGETDRMWRTFSNLLWIMLMFGGVIVALGMIFAPWLSRMVAPGWSDPVQLGKVTTMMRIILPAQLFLMLGGGLFMGALTAHKHFTWPAVGPIIYNCFIIAAGLMAPFLFGVTTVAYGLVLGAIVANFALQIPPMLKLGGRISFKVNFRDPDVWRVLGLAFPVILGLSVSQINWMIVRAFSSFVGENGPSVLEFANRLWQLPSGMFAAAIGIALLPSLSEHFAKHDEKAFARDFSFGMRNTLFLVIPTTLILGVMRFPVIRLIYEHGTFKSTDTPAVAAVMLWLTPAMIALSVVFIVARGFYARLDSIAPVKVGVMAVVVCFVLGRLLVHPFGLVGLAMATSVGNIINGAILLVMLKRRVRYLDGRHILASVVRMLPGCLTMSAVMWLGMALVERYIGTHGLVAKLVGVLIPLGAGGLVFVIFSRMSGCEELHSAWQMVRRRKR